MSCRRQRSFGPLADLYGSIGQLAGQRRDIFGDSR
jgi:hypothetical protein